MGLSQESTITIITGIITMASTISSVFISNNLGFRTYKKKMETGSKAERYNKFYVPLLKMMYYSQNDNGLNLLGVYERQREHNYIANRDDNKRLIELKRIPYQDEFVDFIMNNLNYASPELISKCIDYSRVVGSIYWSATWSIHGIANEPDDLDPDGLMKKIHQETLNKYNEDTLSAIQLFFPLIEQILKESSELAVELKEEDLSQSLEPYMKSGHNYSKRLVQVLQKSESFEVTLLRELKTPY